MELDRAIEILTQYVDEYAVCDYAPIYSEVIDAMEKAVSVMKSIVEVRSGT